MPTNSETKTSLHTDQRNAKLLGASHRSWIMYSRLSGNSDKYTYMGYVCNGCQLRPRLDPLSFKKISFKTNGSLNGAFCYGF
jgi:hypothetical protein